MRVGIQFDGSIAIFNDDYRLHSFNNKPAYIKPDGTMYWYNDGQIIKSLSPSGIITICNKLVLTDK